MNTAVCPRCGGARSGGLCPRCTIAAALETGTDADEAPQRIGNCEVFGEIARGGNGVVYRAWQGDLKREVALKMLLSARLERPATLQRFRREAELMAQLDDPGILPVYEVGEEGGVPYFCMKLAEGGNLAERIAGLRGRFVDIARLLASIAHTVDRAHRHGVLHRDLKPSNIVFDTDDRPLVTDFGLARHLGADSSLTGSEALLGTPRYVAPEVITAPGARLTPAVDVYGLGAILCELLTGRPPFPDLAPLQVLQQVATRPPVAPRALDASIPRGLEAICLRCLEKRPGDRYASARELALALEAWCGEMMRPSRWWRRGSRFGVPSHRRRLVALLAACAMLGGASMTGLLAWLNQPMLPDPAVVGRTLAVVPADPAHASAAVIAAVRSLSARLAGTQPLQVVPADRVLAVAQRKDFPADAVQRGELLGAYVQVKISAVNASVDGPLVVRAIDGLRKEELWSGRASPTDLDAAAIALSKALASKRAEPTPETHLPPAALAQIVRGVALDVRQDKAAIDEAIAAYRRTLALAPACASAHVRLADAYGELAATYNDSAFWLDAAIEEANRAARLDPTLGAAYSSLGDIYYFKGWFGRAATAYEHARALRALGVDNGLGIVYYQQGRYDESFALFFNGLDFSTPSMHGAYMRAQVLYTLGATDAGDQMMRSGLALEPRAEKRNEAEAEMALYRGDFARCRQLAEPLDPLTISGGFYSAGEVAMECAVPQGDYAGALRDLAPAIALHAQGKADRGNSGPMIEEAILLRLLGRGNEAAPLLEQARQAAQAGIDDGSEFWKNWRRLAAVQRVEGDVDGAYRTLDVAFAHGMRISARTAGDLQFLPFRDDARFAELRKSQAAELAVMRERALAMMASPPDPTARATDHPR